MNFAEVEFQIITTSDKLVEKVLKEMGNRICSMTLPYWIKTR